MSPDGHTISMASVGDARGRPVHIAGLSSWLSCVAPVGERGCVSIAILPDQRVRAPTRRSSPAGLCHGCIELSSWRECFAEEDAKVRIKSRRLRPEWPRWWKAHWARSSSPVAWRAGRRTTLGIPNSPNSECWRCTAVLHLLGYDHECDQGRMLRVEQRLRRKGGLREGLIERESPARRGRQRTRGQPK